MKEFLRLALHDEKKLNYQYKRILAITFTNKAAAEMKNRVIETLHELSSNNTQSATASLLSKELNISTDVLSARASTVLSQVLHNYSDLSIGTIDSFTHKIVRSFAHDLKLPVNFNIELDTAAFYQKVVASLLDSIGDDEYVSKLLKEFALNNASDNAGWDPEKAIQEFTSLMQKEESSEYLDILLQLSVAELDSFRLQFIEFVKVYKKHLRTEGGTIVALIKEKGLNDDHFYRKSGGPHRFFYKCASAEVNLEDANGVNLNKVIENGAWENTAKGLDVSGVQAINNILTQTARELIAYIQENYTHFMLCQKLLQRMYPLMLVKKIEELSQQQKQEERLVFLSEFNERIFELIQNEPTPFIYERLGERYQSYLLDEFQDTSTLQWQNLLPLIDNSLANGWFNLVVGDGKQSIYRWRSANVKQFAGLPAIEGAELNPIIQERQDTLKRNYHEEKLQTNYRSSAEVINFNNAFFRYMATTVLQPEQQNIYDALEQGVHNKHKGYVSLLYGARTAEEVETETLDTVLKQINEALSDGYSYSDICIISRKNKNSFKIADFLLDKGVPVVSSDSLALIANEEVNVLVNYLTYLSDTANKIAAAAVLEYVCKELKVAQQKIHQFRQSIARGNTLSSVLRELDFELNEDDFKLLNVFDAAVAIITTLDLTKKGYHYLRFFLDEISGFLQNQTAGIADFLDWWERRSAKASLIIPDSTNAIKVMTMHVSKGLEFPVVILPFVNWELNQASEKWVHLKTTKTNLPVSLLQITKSTAELGFESEFTNEVFEQNLDNLNLLYVAFTRAAQRLHIIALKSNNKETVVKWIEDYAQKNLGANNTGFYEFGERSAKVFEKEKHSVPAYALDPLHFEKSHHAVTIKSAAKLSSDETEDALKQGVLLHWLLSMIVTPDDIQAALQKGVEIGELRASEVTELAIKLSRLLEKKELAESFDSPKKVWIERELYSINLGLLRPDRFTEHEGFNLLIDYKTGKEQVQKHSKQLLLYQQALQQMGYSNIRKLLVYIDEEQVVEVN